MTNDGIVKNVRKTKQKEANRMTSKGSVRSDFRYVRDLMRQAETLMQKHNWDQKEADDIANNLIAAVTTFAQYVEDLEQNKGETK
jgi:hypothetical protein